MWRVLFWVMMPRAMDSADAIHYIDIAKQFCAGQFFHFDDNLPVLYSALSAFIGLFVSDLEFASSLVSLVASTLLVVPVYLISWHLHGAPSARIAALCVCRFGLG